MYMYMYMYLPRKVKKQVLRMIHKYSVWWNIFIYQECSDA